MSPHEWRHQRRNTGRSRSGTRSANKKKIIITAVFTAMDKMLDRMAIVDVVANIAFFLDLFSQPIMSVKVKQRKIE